MFINERRNRGSLDCVIALYNLKSKKIPTEVIKIIVKYAIPIMYCNKCGYILQKNYNHSDPLSWIITDDDIKCKKCYPTLNELWYIYKLSKIDF